MSSTTHNDATARSDGIDPPRLRQADIIHERTGFSERNPIDEELVWRDHVWGVENNFVHCVQHLVLPSGANLLVASQDYVTKQ